MYIHIYKRCQYLDHNRANILVDNRALLSAKSLVSSSTVLFPRDSATGKPSWPASS